MSSSVTGGGGTVDATSVAAAGAVMDSDYVGDHSILKANTSGTPVATVIAENTLVGRKTGSSVYGVSNTDVRTILNVEDGADVTDTTNVNGAGAVMESDYVGDNSVIKADTSGNPTATVISENTLVGRKTGSTVYGVSATDVRTILNVENGADVTDTTNVNSAGATMNSDYVGAHSILKADTSGVPSATVISENTLVGRKTGSSVYGVSPADVRTILNVENGADVTDTTNVNSAGAVMGTDYVGDHSILKANTSGTPVATVISTNCLVGRQAGSIYGMSASNARTLLNVQQSSDLTNYVISDAVLSSDDAEETTANTAFVKIKEFTLTTTPSQIRVKFDIAEVASVATAYGQLYRNGGSIGTPQSQTGTAYLTKTLDYTGWSDGDTCELWIRHSTGGTSAKARNFRVCGVHENISSQLVIA